MPRKRIILPVLVGIAPAAAGLLWLGRPADPLGLTAADVTRVEVEFLPWGEDGTVAPGGGTADPAAVADLVAVVRSGRPTPDHKCGSRAVVRLVRPVRPTVELAVLPGHDPKWYEVRAAGAVYRVPRAEFLAAVRRAGVELPTAGQ